MQKEELKEFYKYLAENKLLSAEFGTGSAIIEEYVKKQPQNELLTCLQKYPELIRKQEYSIYDKRKQITEAESLLKGVEQSTYSIIEAETDANGKKIYSNDDKRRIETAKRLSSSAQYVEAMSNLTKLKEEVAHEEIEFNFLTNTQRNARAIALILGDE